MTIPANLTSAPRVLRGLLTAAVLCAVLLLGVQTAVAQVTNRHLDLVGLYQTDLRALAMGNAYGPIARGEGALLHNPAGLVQFSFDIKGDAALSAEGEAGDFFSDTVDLTQSSTAADIQQYLTKYLGTTQQYRAQIFTNIVANLGAINIGAGGGRMDQTRFSFEFQDTNANLAFDLTDTLVQGQRKLDIKFVSFAFALFDSQMLLGVTTKDFQYKEETGTATFGSLLTANTVDIPTTGSEYEEKGVDVGMIWRIGWFPALRAQWSLVGYNVGGITLTPINPADETLEVPATYNFGISINPEFSFLHVLVSAELEDISDEILVRDPIDGLDHKRSSKQRLHFGAEVGIWELSTGNHILNARVGSHRGFTSYGYEINLFSGFRILYTKYRENLGHQDRQDLHDFEALQISIGAAF